MKKATASQQRVRHNIFLCHVYIVSFIVVAFTTRRRDGSFGNVVESWTPPPPTMAPAPSPRLTMTTTSSLRIRPKIHTLRPDESFLRVAKTLGMAIATGDMNEVDGDNDQNDDDNQNDDGNDEHEDDNDEFLVVEEEDYFSTWEQKEWGIVDDDDDDVIDDKENGNSLPPELTFSELSGNTKTRPRRRAPLPLPSPTRKKDRAQGPTSLQEKLPGSTTYDSAESTNTQAVTTSKDHNVRLNDLARTMEQILLKSKKTDRIDQDNETTIVKNQSDGKNNDDDENRKRRKLLLQKFSTVIKDDIDGESSNGNRLRGEDEETISLLRKAKDEQQYGTAAQISEQIQQKQQLQRLRKQYQPAHEDTKSPESVKINSGIYDDDDVHTADAFQQRQHNEQFIPNFHGIDLPSLEEENEELIQLLQRARRDGRMASPLFDEDDNTDDDGRISLRIRKFDEHVSPPNDEIERNVENRHSIKASPSRKQRDDDDVDRDQPMRQLLTGFERSSDGSVFLSPEAYKLACEGDITNPDGSLQFVSGINSNSKRQQKRRTVKVSPDALNSEGPMAPYHDPERHKNWEAAESSVGYGGSRNDGNDLTLDELMDMYQNRDRSLIDVVVGWKGVSQLETARSIPPTAEQEEKFRKLLDEADQIEDRAYKDRQIADPAVLYRKLYENEINQLDQRLNEIRNDLGLNPVTSNISRNEGGTDSDPNSFDLDIFDGEDSRGVFFADTPAGKQLEEMIEQSRIDHQKSVARFYSNTRDGEDEWGEYDSKMN